MVQFFLCWRINAIRPGIMWWGGAAGAAGASVGAAGASVGAAAGAVCAAGAVAAGAVVAGAVVAGVFSISDSDSSSSSPVLLRCFFFVCFC